MKRLSSFFAFSMALFLFSCSNSTEKTDTKAADTTAAVVAPPPAPVKPAFQPFKVVSIVHPVKNFSKWKEGYLSHDSVRKAYGLSDFAIGRDLKDSNLVYVFNKMEDAEKAKTFATLPNLKDAMKKAGVTGPPKFGYADVIRFEEPQSGSADRLMVTHHVKDYAAWIKAYDSEGAATRVANGMTDIAISRGIPDSNLVTVVFQINDITKAKARVASPDLKKIMTDAGVDGPPAIYWFTVVK